jgi:hypothetical protein
VKRKLVGNLIPAVIGVIPIAVGLLNIEHTLRVFGPGLVWVASGVVLTWLAVDLFGLAGNARMRREMMRLLAERKAEAGPGASFVGCATPSYRGWLDPHEDVGFLCLGEDRLTFRGDSLQLVLMKADVQRIRFRPNAHTIVGLGRWVSIEGSSQETPFRLLVEPRVKATLLGNLRYSKVLKARLEAWLKADGARA